MHDVALARTCVLSVLCQHLASLKGHLLVAAVEAVDVPGHRSIAELLMDL
jgi:hypothetical protein